MTTSILGLLAAYLHVIGVATYLGGSIIMEFVVGPAQESIPPAQAMVLGKKVADRFLVFVWSSLGLILASGLLRLFTHAAFGTAGLLVSDDLFGTTYGRTLFIMICLWVVLVINGSIITFSLRPRLGSRMSAQVSAGQVQSEQSGKIKAAKWISRLTRADLVIIMIVALLGSSLGFGGLW